MQHDDIQAVHRLHEAYRAITEQLGRVIVGQEQVIEELLVAMFARGHCLLVGVPGLAKTLLIRTLSEALALKFSRIQFTPDLMPSDITGTEVIQEDKLSGTRELRFLPGPVFANVILADEINRTPPNPIEQEGTYPLPEAQLDRFMFNTFVDYPGEEEEFQIVKRTTADVTVEVTPTLQAEEIVALQRIVRRVPVADHEVRYALRLTRSTRPNRQESPQFIRDYVSWGAGPRASQYLVLGAKARAVLQGRFSASCDDIGAVAHPVLRHRILTNFNAEADRVKPDDVVRRLLESVPVDDKATGGNLPELFRSAGPGAS
jgi:MoxR-like ATPase